MLYYRQKDDNNKGCWMWSSFTAFITENQSLRRIFHTAEVPIQMYGIFTVGYWFQEPVGFSKNWWYRETIHHYFNIETYCTADKSRFNYWIYPHYYKNSQNILFLNIVRLVILWLYFAHIYYKPYLHQKLWGRRPLGGGTRPSFSVFSRKLLRRTTGPPQPSGVTCRTRHTFTWNHLAKKLY